MREIQNLIRLIAKMSYQQALQVFGLTQPVSPEELKKLWRRLSLERHPDHNPELGDEPMKELNQAYDILSQGGDRGYSGPSYEPYDVNFGDEDEDAAPPRDPRGDEDFSDVNMEDEGSQDQIEAALEQARERGLSRQSSVGETVVVSNSKIEEIYVGQVGPNRVHFALFGRPVPRQVRRMLGNAEIALVFRIWSRSGGTASLGDLESRAAAEARKLRATMPSPIPGWRVYGVTAETAWSILSACGVTSQEWGKVFSRMPSQSTGPALDEQDDLLG